MVNEMHTADEWLDEVALVTSGNVEAIIKYRIFFGARPQRHPSRI